MIKIATYEYTDAIIIYPAYYVGLKSCEVSGYGILKFKTSASRLMALCLAREELVDGAAFISSVKVLL